MALEELRLLEQVAQQSCSAEGAGHLQPWAVRGEALMQLPLNSPVLQVETGLQRAEAAY